MGTVINITALECDGANGQLRVRAGVPVLRDDATHLLGGTSHSTIINGRKGCGVPPPP